MLRAAAALRPRAVQRGGARDRHLRGCARVIDRTLSDETAAARAGVLEVLRSARYLRPAGEPVPGRAAAPADRGRGRAASERCRPSSAGHGAASTTRAHALPRADDDVHWHEARIKAKQARYACRGVGTGVRQARQALRRPGRAGDRAARRAPGRCRRRRTRCQRLAAGRKISGPMGFALGLLHAFERDSVLTGARPSSDDVARGLGPALAHVARAVSDGRRADQARPGTVLWRPTSSVRPRSPCRDRSGPPRSARRLEPAEGQARSGRDMGGGQPSARPGRRPDTGSSSGRRSPRRSTSSTTAPRSSATGRLARRARRDAGATGSRSTHSHWLPPAEAKCTPELSPTTPTSSTASWPWSTLSSPRRRAAVSATARRRRAGRAAARQGRSSASPGTVPTT